MTGYEMEPIETETTAAYENADRLSYFYTVYDGFQRAARATRGVTDRFYTIGPDTIRLRFAGEGLIPHLALALAHLETGPVSVPALTVCLWDSVSTATRLPLLVSTLVELLHSNPWAWLDARAVIKGFNNSRIQTNFAPGSGVLSVLDAQQNLAVYWVNDGSRLPYYEKGSPLKGILSCWTASRSCQYLHAGAVGKPAGGVLLAGKGGSGKSTTALACISAGLSYASDDYCLVASDPLPYVYSLYNTAKLGGDEDIRRFPHLVPLVSNPDRADGEKLMIFLQQHFPSQVVRGFPIRAVLLPRITGQPETRLRPATAGAALAALAPSTIFQLPNAGPEAMRSMAKLLRQVPCYALECGTDVSRIPPVIEELLSGVACT